MTRARPRIIKRNGIWIVATEWCVLASGIFIYSEAGTGKTPKQAWDNAFPTPFKEKLRAISLAQVGRLKNALKVKTADELVKKIRGLFVARPLLNRGGKES